MNDDRGSYVLTPLRPEAGWCPAELTVHLGRPLPAGGRAALKARYSAVDQWGDTEILDVHHPWSGSSHHRVAIGRVILRDERDEAEELFTFGGNLAISVLADETACHLTTPAPVVALQHEPTPMHHEITTDVISEVEALLARLRATSGLDADEFERRLNAQSPAALYLASLASVQEVLAHIAPALRARRGYQLAGRAVRELVAQAQAAGRWSADQPTLAQLLAKAA